MYEHHTLAEIALESRFGADELVVLLARNEPAFTREKICSYGRYVATSAMHACMHAYGTRTKNRMVVAHSSLLESMLLLLPTHSILAYRRTKLAVWPSALSPGTNS